MLSGNLAASAKPGNRSPERAGRSRLLQGGALHASHLRPRILWGNSQPFEPRPIRCSRLLTNIDVQSAAESSGWPRDPPIAPLVGKGELFVDSRPGFP
jgi:hypothetical protein